MIIERVVDRVDSSQLIDVNSGECFEANSTIFMVLGRTIDLLKSNHRGYVFIADIETGRVDYWPPDEVVKKVKVKAVKVK